MSTTELWPSPVFGPRSMKKFGKPLTDRKSTRLNSSHLGISYAVFCLKKKKQQLSYFMTLTSTDDYKIIQPRCVSAWDCVSGHPDICCMTASSCMSYIVSLSTRHVCRE